MAWQVLPQSKQCWPGKGKDDDADDHGGDDGDGDGGGDDDGAGVKMLHLFVATLWSSLRQQSENRMQ